MGIFVEQIEIYGIMDGFMPFYMPVWLHYDPYNETTEEAIVRELGGHGKTFEGLAVQRGWTNAYWTYPSHIRMRQEVLV